MRWWLALLSLVGGALATASAPSCSRHADLLDEPDAATIAPTPVLDAGDIPELETDLGTDAFPACAERPLGGCAGPVDFPCAFPSWAEATAITCQEETGCVTHGWLEVTMAADGCVAAIGMDQPNEDMIACLVEVFGPVRCPCGEATFTYFFGTSNEGCR